MRLVQLLDAQDQQRVALVAGDRLRLCQSSANVAELATRAYTEGIDLSTLIDSLVTDDSLSYDEAIAQRRLLPPVSHRDPAHQWVTGTGLTHLGSASARDKMHAAQGNHHADETDTMRLFRWGVEGGKPPDGGVSVQPEWFYKGDGDCVAPPEHPLASPAFALDGGEEAELVGLYAIAPDGVVVRIGFAIGNEFADHVMERQNYLYLAHSKLRPCSFGPELLVGDAPESIEGSVAIRRGGETVWSATFLTGAANMAYELHSLEHHHFKYSSFRRPGDVHCHFFGTATLSFAAGVRAEPGDVFEVSAPGFGKPLRNPLAVESDPDRTTAVHPCR
ncbi:Fumarylacetoacetate (FAA) hydrolase family protein [Pirellulimonas nuda]|uniref:Fumarylacetoacetate (FAA) hydrolase family protein n=1 Tax=Pirellulimonas nuda TaxID=2528009 RepID=A0A518DGT1_9BACT|nr:AraD1 family protein [Pirellulimonas nuda]QDU90683.1 Fumarylacetoacetate (FAA) hydrolase family protein [Pirellulimonas nuda]